jgi:hypothetical protein
MLATEAVPVLNFDHLYGYDRGRDDTAAMRFPGYEFIGGQMFKKTRDPHYFDCPSCKAFATLRLLSPKRRNSTAEYECGECHSRHGEDLLQRESTKRAAKG